MFKQRVNDKQWYKVKIIDWYPSKKAVKAIFENFRLNVKLNPHYVKIENKFSLNKGEKMFLKIYNSYNKKGDVQVTDNHELKRNSNSYTIDFNPDTGEIRTLVSFKKATMIEKLSEYFFMQDKTTQGRTVDHFRGYAKARRLSFMTSYNDYVRKAKMV